MEKPTPKTLDLLMKHNASDPLPKSEFDKDVEALVEKLRKQKEEIRARKEFERSVDEIVARLMKQKEEKEVNRLVEKLKKQKEEKEVNRLVEKLKKQKEEKEVNRLVEKLKKQKEEKAAAKAVVIPKKEFVEEHKKLVSLMKPIAEEVKKQEKELKEVSANTCPICGKEFKNLGLHFDKLHSALVILHFAQEGLKVYLRENVNGWGSYVEGLTLPKKADETGTQHRERVKADPRIKRVKGLFHEKAEESASEVLRKLKSVDMKPVSYSLVRGNLDKTENERELAGLLKGLPKK